MGSEMCIRDRRRGTYCPGVIGLSVGRFPTGRIYVVKIVWLQLKNNRITFFNSTNQQKHKIEFPVQILNNCLKTPIPRLGTHQEGLNPCAASYNT